MSDIVERLRGRGVSSRYQPTSLGQLSDTIFDEAAAEIKRLRAAIDAENEACARLVELSRKLAGTTIVAAAIRARVKQ